MKNFLKLKPIYRIVGIIALVAVIGFAVIACDNGMTGGGGLGGTYYYSNNIYITLNNGNFTGHSLTFTRSGTYSVQGSTLRLSTSFYGQNWTIVNANTLIDGQDDYWTRR